MNNAFNLQRFVDAQEPVIDDVFAELRKGKKRSHWMWFIFPQFDGLGSSQTARQYAIKSMEEAREYLKHEVLGSSYYPDLQGGVFLSATTFLRGGFEVRFESVALHVGHLPEAREDAGDLQAGGEFDALHQLQWSLREFLEDTVASQFSETRLEVPIRTL